MTVAELIAMLLTMPQDYEVNVDRGGAYSDAKSVDQNDRLKSVFISADEE